MKNALILGLGKSGIAAAELLLSQGVEVFGFDDNLSKVQESSLQRVVHSGLQIVSDITDIDWNAISCVVVSPGVSPQHPIYHNALLKNIEVLGEIELALRFLNQKAVAITGTNGKTTVTLLTVHILNEAGIKARALGNVGEPLSTYVLNKDPQEVLVIELSSFQIETLHACFFDAAVILNITPDHLDRYPDMQGYADAKCKIQRCLKENGALYVHYTIPREFKDLLRSPYITFGASQKADLLLDGDAAMWSENVEFIFPKQYRKWGKHDKENALVAWALCRLFNVNAEQFCQGLQTFQKPPHRLEFVGEIDGICYYDDSKGTNIDAVVRAVDALSDANGSASVILIAGGVDKGASYLPWTAFRAQVKCILVLGQAAQKINEELSAFFDIECVGSLSDAVKRASERAVKEDIVLLSPGCSSYDMFLSYAHRGQEFQRCVRELKMEHS